MALEREIIIRARAKDEAATEAVLEYFKPTLRSYANSYFILGGDKDDVIQEGTYGLFLALRDYDSTQSEFETFAKGCIRKRIFAAIRVANSQKQLALNSALDENALDTVADGDPLELILRRERLALFYEALNTKLSKIEKEVTGLYISGYSYARIAEILGKSIKSVDNALVRVRKKLSGILEDDKD